MPRKPMTPEQRKAFGERMKALREAKKNEEKESEGMDNASEPATIPEPKVEQVSVETTTNTIKLKFTKKIDVRINGKLYAGPEVEVDDIKIASEIVRLAKEAYGYEIFA